MATSVEELVEMLFDMIDEAKNAPLSSGKCVIDRERALDLLDDIKDHLPKQLAEAKDIINHRSDYVESAKREADEIRRRAEIEAKALVDEARVMSEARRKASDLLRQAEDQAKAVRRSANEYCADVLSRSMEALATANGELKQVHTRFQAAVAPDSAPSSPKNSRVFDAEAEE